MTADQLEYSVLVFAPVGRDSELLTKSLSTSGINCSNCPNFDLFADATNQDFGAIFLTEEALTPSVQNLLSKIISLQPSWSDVPIILCVSPSSRWNKISLPELTRLFGNLTIIDRPIRKASLISAIQVALRARSRQYECRNFIAECQKLNSNLVEASQRKDELLAMLGHELRNPLAALTTALDLLDVLDNDPETMHESLDIAKRQTEQIARLVNDLLDMSRLLTGRVQLKLSEVSVANLIGDAVETLRGPLKDNNHELEIVIPSEPMNLLGDRGRLQQVLENLLANSCKYTPPGGSIAVGVERLPQFAKFYVRDTGSGFDDEDSMKLFDLFIQGQQSIERSAGGLGIGLTIVRQIVELHGGEVCASSPGIDQGSEFSFTVPLSDGSNQYAGEYNAGVPSVNKLKVLIVEDNKDLVTLMRKLVERLGHETSVAHDGKNALLVANEFRPDVVLLDIGLPGLNGYEVASELKSNSISPPLIVAVSGYWQEVDRQKGLAAGFDYHYPKPLDTHVLKHILQSYKPISHQ